jgi:hypothetical protein
LTWAKWTVTVMEVKASPVQNPPRRRKEQTKDKRPRMTRELAEKRAFGDPSEGIVDTVAWLRNFKK